MTTEANTTGVSGSNRICGIRCTLICGGIGSGKSVVARTLRLKGYDVYDCDLEARRIMDGSPLIRSAIAEKLGAECLNADGTLCRPAIAAKVFASDEQRLWLNSLVHHHVADDIRCWLHDAASGKRRFVETAIPVTSGLTDICNDIWLVTCPDSVRVERIIGRDNCSPAQAQSRIDAQRHEFDSLPPETTELIENDPATPILLRIDSLLKK